MISSIYGPCSGLHSTSIAISPLSTISRPFFVASKEITITPSSPPMVYPASFSASSAPNVISSFCETTTSILGTSRIISTIFSFPSAVVKSPSLRASSFHPGWSFMISSNPRVRPVCAEEPLVPSSMTRLRSSPRPVFSIRSASERAAFLPSSSESVPSQAV